MKNCILRGVPPSLLQDAWWLGPITHLPPGKARPRPAQSTSHVTRRYVLHALLLAGLIMIAQLPGVTETSVPPMTKACGSDDVLGFQAATGLRSLMTAFQLGSAL